MPTAFRTSLNPSAGGLDSPPTSGYALWLDGRDTATLFTDAGVTAITTNGQSVYQWNDKSGSSRNAIQATSASRPTWLDSTGGRNGYGALAFNGSSQFISVPHSASYGIGTNSFTMEAWIKLNAAVSSGAYHSIACKYSAGSLGTDDAFQILLTNNSGTMQLYSGFVTGSTENSFFFTIPSVNTSLNGVWNHVAISRSGSSLRAFFNGTQIGTTQTFSGNINAGNSAIVIGARTYSPFDLYLNGQIQNFIFYNDQALYTANFTPWMS